MQTKVQTQLDVEMGQKASRGLLDWQRIPDSICLQMWSQMWICGQNPWTDADAVFRDPHNWLELGIYAHGLVIVRTSSDKDGCGVQVTYVTF